MIDLKVIIEYKTDVPAIHASMEPLASEAITHIPVIV